VSGHEAYNCEQFHPPPEVQGRTLVFSAPTSATAKQNMLVPVSIPLFDASLDPEGAKYHVPYMESFYDNSLQSGLMRDLAVDLEVLGEHLVLLGNQGVGKNKVIDR
jgi:von Willebrand factor A domain-containing protein 8